MLTKTYLVIVLFCHQSLVFSMAQLLEHPPSFVNSPPQLVIFRENGAIVLECEATGNPTVRYTWKKDGANVDLNAPYVRSDNETSTLNISAASHSDEGFYQCIAQNKHGIAFSNISHVRKALLEPVGPTQETIELTAVEDVAFVIPASDFNVFPRPRSSDDYVWLKYTGQQGAASEQIVPNKRVQIADNGDLHFAYALQGDDLGGKLYMNALNNSYLGRALEGNYTKLVVRPNSNNASDIIPSISSSSISSIPAMIGESVTLRCIFSGKPEPSVLWARSGDSLPADRYILSKDNTALTLINVTKSDETNYSCIATNSQGSTTHQLTLQVQAYPRFSDPMDRPQELNIVEKDNVLFHCNAFALPQANVVWFFNGHSLNDKPLKRFSISADQRQLTIDSVCLECKDTDGKVTSDTGVIQCNASNVHGYVIGTGYLNVITLRQAEVINSAASGDHRFPFEVAFIFILTILISF